MSSTTVAKAGLSSQEKRALLRQLLREQASLLDSFPLSFAQERLWFLSQWEQASSAYNVSRAIRIRGLLNIGALRDAFKTIVSRHESLRTTFAIQDGQPMQVISEHGHVEMPLVDLSSWSGGDHETEVQRLATEEAVRIFDLSQGPSLRTTLLRLNEEEHVLLLTIHHIVSDGWSMRVLFKELAALYEALSTGKPSSLPDLPIQYADFTVWQREWLQGEVVDSQLAYWKQQLGGDLPVLELPTDHPRPAVQTFRGAHHSFVLPQRLSERLATLSQQEGVTLFMTLLAAFKTLLHRYIGQEDIVVGSPAANRNRSEVEGLIGFFVNTLVLRTDLSDDPTFRELLGRVREMAVGAYAHQDLPFEKLVAELQPERDPSHTPLFQMMFALQNDPLPTRELSGLALEPVEIETGTAKFDLTLYMLERELGLQGVIEYNTDLFEAATIARMTGHFRTLLEDIVANPDGRISRLTLLTEEEQGQLLVEWNATKMDYAKDQCIHQLFESQVARTPDAIAAVFEGEHLTYQELNRRANQLAHYLQGLGVGPEVLVGIYVERSLEMLVGLLGILKAGGTYVPLDPAYPKQRLAFMLEDAQVSVILTQARLVAELPDHNAETVCMDTHWEVIEQEREEDPSNSVTADNLAYVIYTSGSTGKPKGVQILHRAVVNFLMSMRQRPGMAERDILLSVTTLSFDIAVLELFLPLTVGACTVVVSRDVAVDGARLIEVLASSGANVMQATPATWRLLLEAGWPGSQRLKILCGGEALPSELADQLLSRGASLWNMYGPTETTIWSTVYEVGSGNGPMSIGRPIANTEIFVLDRHLQPVPIGVPGELYIGGHGLARGYLNRPELTREKFIPAPFNVPGARLYKTGDLARYLSDGNIELLGRIDHQVKMRGFRIELEEIEAVLSQHPSVRQAVAVAQSDIPNEQRLVAYVVPKPGGSPTFSELRSFLKATLPDYMLPSAVALLEALPLTPNGKINRRALPALDMAGPDLERAFAPPRDALELKLIKIWERVLNVHSLGVSDNFFEMGGHSLLGVRLFAQIEKEFGVRLPLAALFQAPTVEQLADVLRRSRAGWPAPWSSLVPIQLSGSKLPFFCVPGNLGNVFIELGDLARHLGPDYPLYGLQDGIHNPAQIEALAAHYVTEIRTAQPQGPYLLGGVCSGGVVAFEMAQQFLAQGQEVGLLALVEPSPPRKPGLRSYLEITVAILRRAVERSGHHSRQFRRHASGERETYTRLKAKVMANMYALARYAPQAYPGQIILFLGNRAMDSYLPSRQMGWRDLAAGGIKLHTIPGDHDTIVRTNDTAPEDSQVQALAEALRGCIDSVVVDDRASRA
jgi:amino acid adenylation domain-containing protein